MAEKRISKDSRGRDVPVERYHQDKAGKKIESRWWTQDEATMHEHVFGVVKKIRDNQEFRTAQHLQFARLYGNQEILGLQSGLFARVHNPTAFLSNRTTFNVISACIDAASAKIAKNKPRPMYQTDDGDWSAQRRAQTMTAYMEGLFQTMGTGTGDNRSIYGVGRRSFADSGVFGTGTAKMFREGDAVKTERTLVEELVVDETEGMYEQPRQMFQEKLVCREVVVDMFPKFEAEIMAAPSGLSAEVQAFYEADMIKLVEGWHLPSGDDAPDGVKFIGIDGATFRVDDWKRSYFPFLTQRWKPRVLGWHGQGIAEELIGIQLEINKLLRSIALAQHLMCVPQVWLEIQNKVPGRQLNNEIGGIRYYTGQPPIFTTGVGMPSEIYQHLESLYRKAFEIVGISQLSATSQKPAGLNSGKALREFSDIETERFALAGQRYEDFYMDAADMAMDLLNEIADEGKNPMVLVGNGEGVRPVEWKDVRMDPKTFKARPFPTSLLPATPSGAFATVQEMTQGGFFDKEEAMELLDFPDIKAVTSIKLAPRRDIKRMVEVMLDKGDYESPEPYMNLAFGRTYAQSVYLKGRSQGMPEDRLEHLRRFMDDCQALIERQQLAAAPAPTPLQPAVPEAAPTSELLPITA